MSWPNSSQNPLVTILLATFNGEQYLTELLDSILAQTYQNWMLLVSDDCSSDATPQILSRYCKKYPDKIRVLEKETPFGCACGNFFYLMRNCSDDYMMFCDQDDIWKSDKIEVTIQRLMEIEGRAEKCPVLVHTDLEVVDSALKPISPSFMQYSKLCAERYALNQLLIQNIVTGCTVMINKLLRDMALEVKDIGNVLMHDWWLALIASAFGEIGYIDKSTIMYRQHGSNEVGAKNTRSVSYILGKLFKNRAIRQALCDTTVQVGELYDIFGSRMSEKNRDMIKGYARLYQQGKLARLSFMIKHAIFKYGLSRKIAQMIWG